VLGVEALDVEALTNLDRIYTSLEQYPELAQVLEQRVPRPRSPTSSSSSTPARPGLRGAARTSSTTRSPRLAAGSSTSSSRPTSRRSSRSSASTAQKGAWGELKVVLRAPARERVTGDSEEAGIRRRWRTCSPRASATCRRGRDLEARARAARRGSGGARRASPISTSAPSSGPSSPRCSSGTTTSPPTTSRAWPCSSVARDLHSEQLGRDDSALDDYSARARHRLRQRSTRSTRSPTSGAVATTRASSSSRCTRRGSRAPASLPAGEPGRDLPRARQRPTRPTLGQPYDAIDAWRRLLEVDPRDFEAMAALENLLRAEERWRR
jgi:hypothetical protein